MPAQAISEESFCRLCLAMTPGLGARLSARLVELCGSPQEALRAGPRTLMRVRGVGKITSDQIASGLRQAEGLAREQLEMAQRAGVRILTQSDDGYPALLRTIPDPPQVLFVRGALDDGYCVAIVGSRRCSAYGIEQAERFASGLATSGLVIVSGGARGIDTAAHRGAARAGGRTIVVLGCGLSHCYPPENRDLFERLIETRRGCIVSELPMQTAPSSENFPGRNRIISGLSLGVLVVEAGVRSGALITARQALEDHQREVMAVPGRVDQPACEGSNDLIKRGEAAMVTRIGDVLEILETPARYQHEGFHGDRYADPSVPGLDGDRATLFELLGEARSVDELIAASGLGVERVRSALTMLEIQGRVRRVGGRFARVGG